VQSRFVDDPAGAMTQVDQLVGQVMQARGYPMGDFETRGGRLGGSPTGGGELSRCPCDRGAQSGGASID
jgi:hypothetical protein